MSCISCLVNLDLLGISLRLEVYLGLKNLVASAKYHIRLVVVSIVVIPRYTGQELLS